VVTPEEWQPVLVTKAKDLLETRFSKQKSAKLIDMMLNLENLDSINDITKLIRGRAKAR